MRKWFFGFFLATSIGTLVAQDADILQHSDIYHFIDRMDIKGVTGQAIPTEIKPYAREQVAEWLAKVDSSELHSKDLRRLFNVRYRVDDEFASEGNRGLWNAFYRNHRDLYSYRSEKFRFYLNPQLYISAGTDRTNWSADSTLNKSARTENTFLFRNTRGLSLRGSLWNKVGFYLDLTDNQAKYPSFVIKNFEEQNNRALFGEGFVKQYSRGGYDYLAGKGYITYSPVKQLRIKFGRDRLFLGNGIQSLMLSDHATDYFFLNLRTQLGNKFEYMNHFAQLIDYIPNKPDVIGSQPRKYLALHQVTYRPVRQISISLFESVVYASSLPNGTRNFELQYLNPIIFYRTVEQYIGSPDNSFLGLQWKVNLFRSSQFYGQFVIDDYFVAAARNGKGWWGNKTALQLGMKYIDIFGISNLDLQLEYNQAEPYSYSHYNTSANYSQYGTP
ncbi:MAG: hypothetical protein NZ108_06715, partial [Bacteroidia bacterium]|nr:hypothetical protein [Bacteroidia bacterium]